MIAERDNMENDENRWNIKYRPAKFKEVAGQRNAVSTLIGALKAKSLPNAYLFTGPSGVGKTTLARILARYLNCEKGSACGACPSCKIPPENHPDVYELNASEKRGIDEVRDLIQKSKYMPRHKKRVIIIDEAHGFTPQALEALLIPLEQPPKHTLYCLCTTDPQKLSKTILTRLTKIVLDFPAHEDIVQRLGEIADAEKMNCSDEVLDTIARSSSGHLREAVNMLQSASNMLLANPKIPVAQLVSSIEHTSDLPNIKLATRLLLALYKDNSKMAVQTIMQVTDTLPFVNQCIWFNTYAMAVLSEAPQSKNFWHSAANKDFVKTVDKAFNNSLPKDMIHILISVNAVLVEVRSKLFTVSTPEVNLLLAHLSRA